MDKQQDILQEKRSNLVDNILLYVPFCIAALMYVACLIIELAQIEISLMVREGIYYLIGLGSLAPVILLSIWYGPKYGLTRKKSITYVLICFVTVFAMASHLCLGIEMKLFGQGSVSAFRSIVFLPILCAELTRYDKKHIFALCDYLAPCYFFQHGLATHACWIDGCCRGVEMNWGLLNPQTGRYVFPTQPCIIIFALGVSLWGIIYASRRNFQTAGKVYAFSMIGYGIFRFFIELLMDDLRVIGPLTIYSIYAVIMVFMGFWLILKSRGTCGNKCVCKTTERTMEEII